MASSDDEQKPRYTQCRKGRWYWEPPLRLRRSHQIEVRPLGSDQRTAWAYAKTLNRDLANLEPNKRRPGSVEWVFDCFFESERFAGLAPSTAGDYRWLAKRLSRLELGGRPLGTYSARALRPRHADRIYFLLKEQGGATTAHYACRFARRVWKWAGRREMVDAHPNPWAGMELPGLPEREQRWTRDQVETFIACCEVERRASIGLATALAYWLGHRQGDVLTLTWAQLDAGERRTNKTGARAVLAPASYPELAARLTAERRRQVALDITPVGVVISEATGKPWQVDTFRHEVRRLARLAGIPDALQFRDLRATAMTELKDAGADIIDMSTHSTHRTVQMARRYARPTPAQFDRAASKRLAARQNKPETDDGTRDGSTELKTATEKN